MSLLAIQLPPRPRAAARAAAEAAAAALPAEWPYVFSSDGQAAGITGHAAASLLPRAQQTVLVLDPADVSWHLVDIPKAPAARLRAALAGVMEERLLEDEDGLHFALGPAAAPGQRGWIAVTHRGRLAAALAALEAGGRSVDRVVALLAPPEPGLGPHGHFHVAGGSAAEPQPMLALAGDNAILALPLAGGLARAWTPEPTTPVRWTAAPAAAAAAEHWLGARVSLLTDAEWCLEAARGTHDLRQFELAARHKGLKAVREAGKRFMSREWRVLRWGVIALVGLQLVGLNAYAWQQRQQLVAQRAAMDELLKSTHPGVRVVLDAPLQMQRETERLRAAAGRPGDSDLEPLLAAASAAWPDGQGPAQTVAFEGGRLTLVVPGLAEAQFAQLRERLRAAGYAAEFSEGRVVVGRAPEAR